MPMLQTVRDCKDSHHRGLRGGGLAEQPVRSWSPASRAPGGGEHPGGSAQC